MDVQLPLAVLALATPADCSGCGFCCEGIGSPVLLYATRPGWKQRHPFRPVDLPLELIAEIDAHFAGLLRGEEPQERCLWFDPLQRSCRHYHWRPEICREYELAGPGCLIRRRTEAESRGWSAEGSSRSGEKAT